MRPIGGIFGRSPFGPTHEHVLKVLQCIELLPSLIDAALAGDREAAARAAGDIRRLEVEADEVKKAIRSQFTTSILAAVSRGELMSLVKAQDDVADECDRFAFELSVRATRFPDFLAEDVRALVSRIVSTRGPLVEVSRILDESGGRPSSDAAARVDALLEDARRSVDDAEPIYDRLLRALFAREADLPPLDVVFIMRLAEHADRIVKKIENVLDVLSRITTEKK
jgi:hypothetical protein